MADLATSRTMIIDDSRKDASGAKIFDVLPWEAVTYNIGLGKQLHGLEPISIVGTATQDNGTDHEVRGIEFVNGGQFAALHGVGGRTQLPK